MTNLARRRTAGVIAGLGAVALIATGCGSDDSSTSTASSTMSAASSTSESAAASSTASSAPSSASASTKPASGASEVTVKGVAGREVTMTGPIAVRYSSASAEEKKILGLPLTGDHNAGTRDSGVVFQQFEGGVITAQNDQDGTPAYLTWGEIRKAWNVERDAAGKPVLVGTNGSAGPLGAATSDVTTSGTVQSATFEHGKITHDTATGTVTVTVNGKTVPSGL